MKAFRILGLLVALLSLTYGAGTARANFPVDCDFSCNGNPGYIQCNGSLATCCSITRRVNCTPPAVYDYGTCTDGTSTLIC